MGIFAFLGRRSVLFALLLPLYLPNEATMPEITENYIRIPNPKHTESDDGAEIRTITVSATDGIKALYCVTHKKIKTYLFDKDKWTMAEAKKWVADHSKGFIKEKSMLILKGYAEKSGEESDGLLDVSVASTAIVDRDGESINQDGWDLKNFKKNPQLLWAHNMRELRPPIGKVTKIWFDGDGKGKVMKFKALFDMADEFAKEVYRKIKDGFLNAFSVGFLPLEKDGSTYSKVELLEISVVPVPSNPQALVEMRSKGIEPMEWKDLADTNELEKKPEEISSLNEEVPVEDEEVKPQKPEEVKPVEGTSTQDTPEKEEIKGQIREVLKEMGKDKNKDLDNLRDALRMVYQAISIALKNLKDMKGGE